jgi:drug/metabolite transporter (DMT)-like permease
MKKHLPGMNLKIPNLFKNTSSSKDKKALSYALVTVLFWSTVATAFKIGLIEFDPSRLIYIATITTLFTIFIIIVSSGKLKLFRELTFKQLLLHSAMGFLSPFAYYLCIFKAYSILPAQVAQPINMVWPIVLVLMSVPLLGRKIGWKSLVALLISFFGVIFISSQGNITNLSGLNPAGIILCIGSAFVWSTYWIFNIKSKVDDQIGLFINFLFGFIYLSIYISFFSTFDFSLSKSLAAGIYIGIFETGISFVFWMKAMSLTSNSAKIANLIYLAPFLSLVFIHFILGEKIFITTILGLFFIISAILFQQSEKSQIA